MARKNTAKKGKDFFDSGSGRVLADLNFAHHRTSSNPKSQIAFIREAFPLRSKDDITLVLQSCDDDVEAAIACFTNGEADNLLKEWNTQGKKYKNGNSSKKKQNKKKQAKQSEPDITKDDSVEKDSENTLKPIQNGYEGHTDKSEEDPKKPTPIASLTLECPSSMANLLPPPSPSSSEMSFPSSNSDTPTDTTQDPQLAPKHSTDSPGSHSPASTPVKFERTMSTGPDALKKTVKDLQRSSVSLPRFQLLLEEECDNSFKSITETFKELRQSLNDRETLLLAQMEEFKKHAVELLEQRQENAAALKLKSERVGGMSETQVTQLRSEIKNFVTERKIDEELAKTTRFVGEKDQILSMIQNFGRVMPIKSCYSPVTLNPPPLPVKKVEENKANREATEAVKPDIPAKMTSATAIPSISLPTEEKSPSSHKALQEVAELHAKLQEALRQQGLSSSKPSEGQKPKPDNRKGRPNSASQASLQNQVTSPRPHTAHPPNQQPRKSHNPQPKESRSGERRGSQQDTKDSNQSNRNPRRGNQRRQPCSRDTRPGSSNDKKETPKEAEHKSQISEETTQQSQLDKEKQSQSENEEVRSQKSDSINKEHAQAHQAREQRDHGEEERPHYRNRRRGGRRGAEGGQNERGYSRGLGDKSKNGPLEKALSEKGPSEKDNLVTEKKKAAVTEGDCDEKESSVIANKSPAVKNGKGNSGASKLQDFSVVNGKETDTGTNSSERLNGEKAHEGDTSIKEALPQRPDRGSRRRGAQRDRKDGPHSRQEHKKGLNGAKQNENGMDHSPVSGESHMQNHSEKPKESSQDEKLLVVGKEAKVQGQMVQDHDKDFDKSPVSKVNGYIPVKEVNEVSIDR